MPLICPSRLTIIRNSKMTAPIRITFPIAIRFRSGCRTTLVIFFRMFPVLVAASLTFPGTLPVKSSVCALVPSHRLLPFEAACLHTHAGGMLVNGYKKATVQKSASWLNRVIKQERGTASEPFPIDWHLAGVPFPAFLLAQWACSSTFSTSNATLSYSYYNRIIL